MRDVSISYNRTALPLVGHTALPRFHGSGACSTEGEAMP